MKLRNNTPLQSGKYRIVRVLGQGGFGITYLAEHTMLDKMVAIKEFFPKEYCDRDEASSHLTVGTKNSVEIVDMLKAKFIKEAKNISKLNHPNIITIHDIFTENDTAYYVMEYVEGCSLAEMVKADGPMHEQRAVGYIRKVADAIGYMHSLSMNHLDIKPANIMVRRSDDMPILIDFGLSKQYDASGGQTSTTPIGISHGFAPIEQYRPGGVSTFTPQTDVYALGATLFNLLTGTLPPHYSEILEDGLPELPVEVSAACADAIEHAMEIKKNKRPESVARFIEELGTDPQSSVVGESRSAGRPTVPTIPQEASLKPQPTVEEQRDETMMIGDFVPKPNISAVDSSISIADIEFVDLGLSVKWANINIGASKTDESGRFFSKRMDGNLTDLYQWNTQGAIVPTIQQFEELIMRCKWYWTIMGETMGYEVVGPNGNSIWIPATGDGTEYPGRRLSTFGLIWTNEALLNEWRDECLMFYFNHSSHYLSQYRTNRTAPIRLVMR